MRKHWIDNLRWVTVLLVLLYHVFYFYNNKGVFGGIGGFGEYPACPQYQDVIMYILYPWFMPLLFILAGISSRYALQKQSAREWFRSRTRKLLVPGTIGLFVFQWIVGYFNTAVASAANGSSVLPQGVPGFVKYFAWSISGTGPLWFIQVLWLLCIVLLIVRALDRKDKFYNLCGKANIVVIILLGILFWAGELTLIRNPRPESPDGLLNLYKPIFYMVPFLLGYFVFSHEAVQEKVAKAWIPLLAAAVVAGTVLIITTFGRDNTSPEYLQQPLNCIYGWLACLGLMGWFAARFNTTGRFAGYMTCSSYGIYIVHYLVIASLGYMMKTYTQLPPAAMYVILAVAVFALSPLLYEILHRIPLIRWCVFGEKGKRK
ncbi:MAG: acyltransferase [Bacteroidales bacterium]|nr:acyltransferase [Bacteroidales bacterium]MBQ6081003.1 acyltransferase [Bacteroidales bacterium]MBQ7459658.1 acyltransferase [Bacteroidales bacterium]MBQ9529218.1 acyltransferase [Bacteroidales bacterium]